MEWLRRWGCTVWYVRNGEVLRVGNLSQGYGLLTLDIQVAYTADIDRAGKVMLETAQALQQEDQWRTDFLGDPELLGVQSLGPDAVVLRLTDKTENGRQEAIARALRSRLKMKLAAEEIPLA